MTAIIAMNLGACALLIADTRKATLDGGGPEDGDRKLFQVGFGMATGAGSRAMIQAVSHKALELKLTPSDISRLMQRYVKQAEAEHPDLDEPAANSLKQTQMIVTLVEQTPSGLTHSKVDVIVPVNDGNYEYQRIGIGSAAICGPTHNAAWEEWTTRCQAQVVVPPTVRMDRAHQPEELISAIETNIQFAAKVLAEIAASNAAVSPSFTVGVQYSPTDVRISGPHETPPDSAWLR